MKKLLLSLLTVAAGLTASAESIELSFPEANSTWNKNQTYAGSVTSTDNQWELINFNNNNNGWDFIKCGPKGAKANVAKLQSANPLSQAISKVVVSVSAVANGTIDAMTLYISDDNTFDANDVTISATIPTTAAPYDITFEIPAPAANKYYCVSVTTTNTTTKNNGVASISKFSFNYNGSGSGSGTETPDVKSVANLAFAETSYSVNLGEAFTAPVPTKDTDAEPSYSSSNTAVATVDAATGAVTILAAGTTEIKAVTAETETHLAGEATYTLTVIDPNSTEVTFDFEKETYGMTRLSGTTQEYNPDPYTYSVGAVTFTLSGKTRLWADGVRFYSGSKITLSVPQNCIIDEVVVTYKDTDPSSKFAEKAITNGYEITTSITKGNSAIKNITVKYSVVEKPEVPVMLVDGVAAEGDEIVLTGAAKKVTFDLPEGVNVWHKFEPASNIGVETYAAHTPEEGYEQYVHENGITLTTAGTLHFYAEKDGQVSETSHISVKGDTTGISKIEADGAEAEWFDLSGRRVAAPAKGIYIRRQGNKSVKMAF